MYSVFQIKSCLCWQVLVTLIHGSNEGHWSILMSSNPLKEFSKNYSVVRIHIDESTTPCDYRVQDTVSCQVQCTISKGVREWLFCSWSGVACMYTSTVS